MNNYHNYPKHRIRIWGNAHGYFGEAGGWIYHQSSDTPICQGWDKIYNANWQSIHVWWENRLANRKKVDTNLTQS